MAFQRYLYIFCAPGMDPKTSVSEIKNPDFQVYIVGVSDPAQASEVARHGVKQGAQVIELCGAFGPEQVARVQAAVSPDVPVGVVTFALDNLPALNRIFGN